MHYFFVTMATFLGLSFGEGEATSWLVAVEAIASENIAAQRPALRRGMVVIRLVMARALELDVLCCGSFSVMRGANERVASGI